MDILDTGSGLDAVAVTRGPGMASCLRIGIEKAKQICLAHCIPLIPVNHLEGHALVIRLLNHQALKPVNFPFFLVLLSGGHSQFLICHDVGNYCHVGGTMDDSLGETFDKIARSLGISFVEGASAA